MFILSPRGNVSDFNITFSFSTGTDSPVSAASSIFNEAASISLKSAGTKSPASKTVISFVAVVVFVAIGIYVLRLEFIKLRKK